ncbi:MAG: CotH kinase family protein, partial [Pseudomonadota bacterium]
MKSFVKNPKLLVLFLSLAMMPTSASAFQWSQVYTTHIELDEESAFSEATGILHKNNREGRGREWERLGLITIQDQSGETVFSSPNAGIRLHGGHSRKLNDPSFRAYFRKSNGAKKIPKKTFFDGEFGKMGRIMVHRANDMVNFIAFDIAQAMQAKVPLFNPTHFYFNGMSMGLYFLGEHLTFSNWLSKEQSAKRREKDDIGESVRYYKFKELFTEDDNALIDHTSISDFVLLAIEDGETLLSARALRRFKKDVLAKPKLTMDDMAQSMDLDNLINHLLPIIYAGNTDWRQGIAILEEDRANTWSFINWDMEHSFFDKNQKNYRRKKGLVDRPAWRQEGFELIMASGVKWWKEGLESQRPFRKWDIRALVFYRLYSDDPKFRAQVR